MPPIHGIADCQTVLCSRLWEGICSHSSIAWWWWWKPVQPCFTAPAPYAVPTSTPAVATKASAAQPDSATWTAHDGYGSEATAFSAASRRSPADNDNHHHRRDSFGQPPPRRGGQQQQLKTASGRLLPGHRQRMKGRTRTSITERREREQDREPREFQGGGDAFDRQSEGGLSSGGSRRGGRNTWVSAYFPVLYFLIISHHIYGVQLSR